MKKAFDKKVCSREFSQGDLVVKKIMPSQKDHRGKWTPNYEGPYVVKNGIFRRSTDLNMDGRGGVISIG